MKIILCLCLFAPLVFGSAIPAGSEVDIQVYDFLGDYLKAPTEEQIKCIQDAVKKVKEANPDLDWWFSDLENLADNVKYQYKKCKDIDKEPAQRKCLLKLKVFARVKLTKIIQSLPADKRPVLDQLKDGMLKCLNESA